LNNCTSKEIIVGIIFSIQYEASKLSFDEEMYEKLPIGLQNLKPNYLILLPIEYKDKKI
jgi:hypothetical protein